MFDIIFFLLTLFALIGLVIGLIKPDKVIKWGEKKTRKQVALIYGVASVAFFILFAIAIPPSEKKGEIEPEIAQSQEGEPSLELSEITKGLNKTEVILSRIVVQGKTETETKVTIQNKEVAVDENGNFKEIVELSIGNNEIQITADNGVKQKTQMLSIKRLSEQEIAERSRGYATPEAPNFLSFICSKPENSHTSFYYLITDYTCPTNQSFTLPEKITDVTVRLSTIQGKTGWDTSFLCSPETKFDLPSYQWQILIPGKDCGLGAKVSPCDIDFISDNTGVTGIVVFPDIKGYVSGVWKYCKKDALFKITGKIVK